MNFNLGKIQTALFAIHAYMCIYHLRKQRLLLFKINKIVTDSHSYYHIDSIDDLKMDDLSEIHLDFDGKMGLLEELYDSTLDHEFTELNVDTNESRPSSTMSFASWSFSPIAQESSEIKDEVLTDSENSGKKHDH